MTEKNGSVWPGTTPTHTFTLPVGEPCVTALTITYRQNGRNILQKTLEDAAFDGKKVSVTLTQTETLMFCDKGTIDIQVRFKNNRGRAFDSMVIHARPGEILMKEVI